tara:strand:- start:41 stop:673 length:633 start_codon:yes stop_codon:yes gene_type:complete
MSQIEQSFREFIRLHPEIIKCHIKGLINRRALAKHLIKLRLVKNTQLEATIAMLRRFDFSYFSQNYQKKHLQNIKLQSKDNINIITLNKSQEILKQIQKLSEKIKTEQGETYKLVVGNKEIKIFIDSENQLFNKLKNKSSTKSNVSEISIQTYSKENDEVPGIISQLTTELALHDIPIIELLTCTPELIIYVKEKNTLKTLEVLKNLQKQ